MVPETIVVDHGKIYVSGGFSKVDEAFPTISLYVYDPVRNTWARKSEMPSGGDF